VKLESSWRATSTSRRRVLRESERQAVQCWFEALKGSPEIRRLKEKWYKTNTLSRREQKILAALADKKRQAA
jgi:hypothetical protein